MAGIGSVGDHRGILLRHLVHLVDGGVDFPNAGCLFLRRLREIGDETGDAGDFIDDCFQRLAGFADKAHALADLIAGGRDELLDFLGGIRRALCQFAHFLGDDRKALAGFTGACGFDTGVQCQQVRLENDVVDDAE